MNALSEKLSRSWQLFKSSVVVIRKHPKLLVFPIVTSLLTVVIALFFLAPLVLVLLAPHWIQNTPWQVLVERWGFVRFHDGTGGNAQFQLLATLMTVLLRDKGEPERQAIISSVASKTASFSTPAMLNGGKFAFAQEAYVAVARSG